MMLCTLLDVVWWERYRMNAWIPREKSKIREACPAGTWLPKGSRDRERAGAGNLAPGPATHLCRHVDCEH